ncbi:MAG: hypothetical protein C0434_07610 [Xanthomonadaceae bacterium]|nr:hypothetical protein [Xanthomonadaceae bacterium]
MTMVTMRAGVCSRPAIGRCMPGSDGTSRGGVVIGIEPALADGRAGKAGRAPSVVGASAVESVERRTDGAACAAADIRPDAARTITAVVFMASPRRPA